MPEFQFQIPDDDEPFVLRSPFRFYRGTILVAPRDIRAGDIVDLEITNEGLIVLDTRGSEEPCPEGPTICEYLLEEDDEL